MSLLRRVRVSAALVVVGLCIQLLAMLVFSPLTFVLFAMLGIPAVLVGAASLLWTVWRHLERRPPAARRAEVEP